MISGHFDDRKGRPVTRIARTALVCSLLGIAAVPAAYGALAAPAGHTSLAADPCSTHLDPNLAFTSGPGITSWKLTGNGSMNLSTVTTKHGFAASDPGLMVPANDQVAEFFFQPSGVKHHFAGPVNGFVHGATTHLCLNQKLYIDFDESGPAKHGTTSVRIDGQLTGKQVSLTIWVMGHTYKLSGKKS
jgi:hypothetical protein